MKFLTDVNVPVSVGRWLAIQGHDVVRVADVMAVNSKDPVVAEAAMRDSRILVSWDRDFGQQRFLKDRFAALMRIGFSCPEPDGAARLTEVFDLIEYAFRRDNVPAEIKIAAGKLLIRDRHSSQ